MKNRDIKVCKCCEKQYSQKEVNRVFGKGSAPSQYGFCSAKCYTKAYSANKSHVLYSNNPITKLF